MQKITIQNPNDQHHYPLYNAHLTKFSINNHIIGNAKLTNTTNSAIHNKFIVKEKNEINFNFTTNISPLQTKNTALNIIKIAAIEQNTITATIPVNHDHYFTGLFYVESYQEIETSKKLTKAHFIITNRTKLSLIPINSQSFLQIS